MTVNKEPSIQEWINEQVAIISQSELSKEYLEVILHYAYEKGQVAGVDSCLDKIRTVETEIVKKEAS
jgi:hypothetical protein